jgi:hypothetical protein
MTIVEACASYGYFDVDSRWIVKQWDSLFPETSFGGWNADCVIGYYKRVERDGIQYSTHQDVMSWLYYQGLLADFE